MINVFLDTNVILDFFLKRKTSGKDHYGLVREVFNKCILNQYLLHASILSLKDVYYIAEKLSKGQAKPAKKQQITKKMNDVTKLYEELK